MRMRLLYWIARLRALVVFTYAGVRGGRRAVAYGRAPAIGLGGRISIGADFEVKGTQMRTQMGAGTGGHLEIHDHVFINQGCNIYAAAHIVIGDNVRLADLVTIYDTNFHEVDEGEGVVVEPVVIEPNVWIGRGAIILPGVTVGRNSVIAAGSIVAADVAPNTLVAGNPAKVKRTLTASDDYIRR